MSIASISFCRRSLVGELGPLYQLRLVTNGLHGRPQLKSDTDFVGYSNFPTEKLRPTGLTFHRNW